MYELPLTNFATNLMQDRTHTKDTHTKDDDYLKAVTKQLI